MRIILIDTAYKAALETLKTMFPERITSNFEEMGRQFSELLFPTIDYWKSPLTEMGDDVLSLTANDYERQLKWVLETNREDLLSKTCDSYVVKGYAVQNPRQSDYDLMETILLAQIEEYKPDVIICGVIELLADEFVKKVKQIGKIFVVGQHQAPLPTKEVAFYDLILSASPHLVENYRQKGIYSKQLRLAADDRILKFSAISNPNEITFFGSASPAHQERIQFLQKLALLKKLSIWTNDQMQLKEATGKANIREGVFGAAMYEKMAASYATINFHIKDTGDSACNLRMYEGPASGTVLITDHKSDLQDIFRVGEEILSYKTPEECAKIIDELENDVDYRNAIAEAGRARVAAEHTFTRRAKELREMLIRH